MSIQSILLYQTGYVSKNSLVVMIKIVAYKTNYTSVLNAAQPICYIHSLVFEYLRGHQIHVVPLFSLQDNQKSIIESYFYSGRCA